MAEYTEPTNEQLASFLTVYARRVPALQHLAVSPAVLEHLMDKKPEFRAGALRHHRRFQDAINEMSRKMMAGELICEHIRGNGRRCVNHNTPGTHYCDLHQEKEE